MTTPRVSMEERILLVKGTVMNWPVYLFVFVDQGPGLQYAYVYYVWRSKGGARQGSPFLVRVWLCFVGV